MKVNIVQNTFGEWFWDAPGQAVGYRTYTRRQDAVRGFLRFQARVRAM